MQQSSTTTEAGMIAIADLKPGQLIFFDGQPREVRHIEPYTRALGTKAGALVVFAGARFYVSPDLAETFPLATAEDIAADQAAHPDTAEFVDPKRTALVNGLRQLADLYARTDLPMPRYPGFAHCVTAGGDDAGRAEVARIAEVLGVEHDPTVYRPSIKWQFAGLEYKAYYVPRQDMVEYNADQQAVADLRAGGWKPGDPVPTPAVAVRDEQPAQVSA